MSVRQQAEEVYRDHASCNICTFCHKKNTHTQVLTHILTRLLHITDKTRSICLVLLKRFCTRKTQQDGTFKLLPQTQPCSEIN